MIAHDWLQSFDLRMHSILIKFIHWSLFASLCFDNCYKMLRYDYEQRRNKSRFSGKFFNHQDFSFLAKLCLWINIFQYNNCLQFHFIRRYNEEYQCLNDSFMCNKCVQMLDVFLLFIYPKKVACNDLLYFPIHIFRVHICCIVTTVIWKIPPELQMNWIK